MSKLSVIVGGFITFILAVVLWTISGNIMGGLEPTIDMFAGELPQWFEWWDLYKQVWNWMPIFVIIAIVLYMFLKGNGEEYDDDYKRLGGY